LKISELSGEISPDQTEKLMKMITEHLPQVGAIAICGTFPPGGSIFVSSTLNFPSTFHIL
jgi:fructose-1-phosphate kinase PfkB-like protein